MGQPYKNMFDLLIASYSVEDFAFGRYFRHREKGERDKEGVGYRNMYPYDEMYRKKHRAKVHWLRIQISYRC